MSTKHHKITELVEQWRGRGADPHYIGYFECFNTGLYFEAHDVLEQLWLADRKGPSGDFYKGLIQLAGAFVHLQKNRLRPSAALFKLADANMAKYPVMHERLDLQNVRAVIAHWITALESSEFNVNPLTAGSAPHLSLDQ